MVFPKVQQQRKKSILAAEALLQVIYEHYKVGDKLPPERQLAQVMNISRSTLREAVAALQLMGLLEVRHSLGNFVIALPDPSDVRGVLENIFTPETDPLGMVDARIAFEPGVTRVATERFTSENLETLHSHLKQIIVCIKKEDRPGYSYADKMFHMCIAEGTQNEYIVQTMLPLIDVVRTPLWQAMKKGLDQESIRRFRIKEHMAVFNAIYRKEPELAAKLMQVHLERSKERFLAEVEHASPVIS